MVHFHVEKKPEEVYKRSILIEMNHFFVERDKNKCILANQYLATIAGLEKESLFIE